MSALSLMYIDGACSIYVQPVGARWRIIWIEKGSKTTTVEPTIGEAIVKFGEWVSRAQKAGGK